MVAKTLLVQRRIASMCPLVSFAAAAIGCATNSSSDLPSPMPPLSGSSAGWPAIALRGLLGCCVSSSFR